jgi:hypothetical protein
LKRAAYIAGDQVIPGSSAALASRACHEDCGGSDITTSYTWRTLVACYGPSVLSGVREPRGNAGLRRVGARLSRP